MYKRQQLGIPLSTLQNLSADEQLQAIGKAIATIPDPAERAAASMEIFGKSGGALNQVFANMDGEIATAKAQLGSLPDVMKAGAAQFDKISDNLTVIGGKFVEFAAGIIDKVKPALDALTTAMTRIDATKLGQDLAGFFTGAGAGMQGFQAAVQAIDAGQLGIAFQIVGQAIQMQFKETGNSIYSTLIATFQTITNFATDQFASGGPLILAITSAFDYVSGYIKSVVAGSLADTFTSLGPAFSRIADGLRQSADAGALSADLALQRIPVSAELAAEKAAESMAKIPDDFKANMAGVPPLFTDIEKHQEQIDQLQKGIKVTTQDTVSEIDAEAKAQAVAEQEARKYFDEYQKGQAKVADANDKKTSDQAKQNQLKQEELTFQLEFASAQAAGDTDHMAALTAQKTWLSDYQSALSAGLGYDQANDFAQAMFNARQNASNINTPDFRNPKDQASDIAKSLGTAAGFADTLSKMNEIKALDKAHNSAKGARDELMAMDKLLGTDLANKSFPDLAKKLGVDKIGQTGEDQIKAVVAYMDKVKVDLSKNPIDSEQGKAAVNKVIAHLKGNPLKSDLIIQADAAQDKIKSLGDIPVTVDAKVDKQAFDNSITNLNADIQNHFTGGTGGSGGKGGTGIGGQGGSAGEGGEGGRGGDATVPLSLGDVMNTIKGFVETIKEKVVTLEGKLPQPVLA